MRFARRKPLLGSRPVGRFGFRLRSSALGLAFAILLPLGVSILGHGVDRFCRIRSRRAGFLGHSPVMGPIKSRIFRAKDGNTNRVVYALDGLRAPETLNGWEIETNVAQMLTDWNINVVMPVGGQSSFYADWNAPSSFFGVPPSGSGVAGTGSGATEAMLGGPGKSYRYDVGNLPDLPAARCTA